ncbi:MAG: Epimerase family protein [Chlamydiae bacterium]|nr:Epimerase family protein [Chlamydiota bacterium]
MSSAELKTSRFSIRSKIERPAEEVFEWYLKPGALERMIPPWEKMEILSHEGNPSSIGSQVVFKIKIGPFSKRWVLEHSEFIEGKSFSNIQVHGPFKFWKYTHYVHPSENDTCEVEDAVEFSAPFSFLNARIEKRLRRIIQWCHERLKNDLQVQNRYFSEPMRILVSGSKGFIGSDLCAFLQSAGHQVVPLTRRKRKDAIYWDPKTGEIDKDQFEGFDAVIHLAGKSIASGFWTKKLKEEIFLSRARDSWLLSQVLLRLLHPPKTLICASAVGIYGNRGDEDLTEKSPPGTGFLADVCQKWEEATSSIENRGTRGVHPRFGLVLSSKGGTLGKLLPAFRLGLGAILGNGKQQMSWISLDDVVYGLYHALMTKEIEGPVNFTAPEILTNASFSKKLAKALHRPLFFRVGEKFLRLILGEMADEMFLASVKAHPEKLQAFGYSFFYPTLDFTLRSTLGIFEK